MKHPFEQIQDDIPRGLHYVAACPYCQHKNGFRIQENFGRQLTNALAASETRLVNCDVENGGCDREFLLRVRAEVVFNVEAFAVRGMYPDAELQEAEPDRRVWEVKIRHADDPEADSTEYLTAEQVAARAKTQPVYALALTFRGDDKLHVVSPDNFCEVNIRCTEPEESERFDSFRRARHVARERALSSGSPVEIYFDGEGSFRLYRVEPLPVPPPASSFELVATVEVPVPFKIQTVQLGAGASAGPENYFVAEVHSDDSRANPGLQEHGNSELFLTEPFEREVDAARAAAEWVHSEFPTLDADIQSVFDLESEDIPL